MYAAWEKVGRRGYADGSAHRILSDLSALAGDRRERLIVAGDWNLLRGYGEDGNLYWKARYDTVFDRADALGLHYVGPEFPNGRQADPWPAELPPDSGCVPTFHHPRQSPPPQPDNSTSCSPPRLWSTASGRARSTNLTHGDPATTAESSSTLRSKPGSTA